MSSKYVGEFNFRLDENYHDILHHFIIQGRSVQRKSKGGGRILKKNHSFCEILKKMSEKGEGEGPSPPPSVRIKLKERGILYYLIHSDPYSLTDCAIQVLIP